jgi:transcriptional antiterminator
LSKTGARIAEKHGVSEKTVRRDAVFAKIIDKIVEEYGDAEIQRKLLGRKNTPA